MKGRQKSKKQVQKIKKKKKTGNEQYKSVVIAVPKSLINTVKLDALYNLDNLCAQAVNEWIENWYWRLDMVRFILIGGATTRMQDESIATLLPSAYIQITGNRMLDILREHYLAIQDKITCDIWKDSNLSYEYKFIYATMARNCTLFSRFINGDFTMNDIAAKWVDADSEYLKKAAQAYNMLTFSEQWSIPVRIFHAFREIRWQWNQPCFQGGSILLDYRVFSIDEAENSIKFNLWVSVTGIIPHARIKIPFELTDQKRMLLQGLFPGWEDTNQRKALLVIRGRHIHISIPVLKEKHSNTAPAEVIGCDVGMTTPISLSNGKQYGKSFNELVKEEYDKYLKLQETRNKFRALQKKAEKSLENISDPDEQTKILKKINEYLRHLSDHRWNAMRRRIKATVSTEIGRAVNLMLNDIQNIDSMLLVMEDLSEMSAEGAKRSRRGRFDLSVWARGELQEHLQEDLEWLYANVAYVVPEYSSQECSECGHVQKDNRNGKKFLCKKCGHTEDADINAAKNIRKRFSDEELQELVKKYSWNRDLRRQKVLELLSMRANQAA